MNEHDAALIIFLKNYELGKVKTRLAQTAGPDQAMSIYRYLVNSTKEIVKGYQGTKYVYYSSFVDCQDQWDHVVRRSQSGYNLGDRMLLAFEEVFKDHQHAMIIGTDCPYLKSEHLQKASQHLAKDKVVIGPTSDGGYYLLGLPKQMPDVLSEIPWSTEQVLTQTIQKLDDLNQEYVLLEELSDIDYEEDWIAYRDLHQGLSDLLQI